EAAHQPMPDTWTGVNTNTPPFTNVTIDGPFPRVIDSFRRQGINLHVQKNTLNGTATPALAHSAVIMFSQPAGSGGNPALDSPDEAACNSTLPSGYGAASFYAIKEANFDKARHLFTHRYAVFAHDVHCLDDLTGSGNCNNANCIAAGGDLGMCG